MQLAMGFSAKGDHIVTEGKPFKENSHKLPRDNRAQGCLLGILVPFSQSNKKYPNAHFMQYIFIFCSIAHPSQVTRPYLKLTA